MPQNDSSPPPALDSQETSSSPFYPVHHHLHHHVQEHHHHHHEQFLNLFKSGQYITFAKEYKMLVKDIVAKRSALLVTAMYNDDEHTPNAK